MPEPRKQVIVRYAGLVGHPEPARATYREVQDHIDVLPENGWVHPEDIRDQLAYELDGARPFA